MLTIEANIKNDKYTSEEEIIADFKVRILLKYSSILHTYSWYCNAFRKNRAGHFWGVTSYSAVNMILKASWLRQVHCLHWPYTVSYNENCEFGNDNKK
jgi:hypothetical protein